MQRGPADSPLTCLVVSSAEGEKPAAILDVPGES